MKLYSSEVFSLDLLREKFENALEISGNLVPQNVATLNDRFCYIEKLVGISQTAPNMPTNKTQENKGHFQHFFTLFTGL